MLELITKGLVLITAILGLYKVGESVVKGNSQSKSVGSQFEEVTGLLKVAAFILIPFGIMISFRYGMHVFSSIDHSDSEILTIAKPDSSLKQLEELYGSGGVINYDVLRLRAALAVNKGYDRDHLLEKIGRKAVLNGSDEVAIYAAQQISDHSDRYELARYIINHSLRSADYQTAVDALSKIPDLYPNDREECANKIVQSIDSARRIIRHIPEKARTNSADPVLNSVSK